MSDINNDHHAIYIDNLGSNDYLNQAPRSLLLRFLILDFRYQIYDKKYKFLWSTIYFDSKNND